MNSLDYRLLRYLLANGTSSLDELAESENVSTRTMQKYIHELGESLGDAAEIRINKNGYFLHILNYRKFSLIQSGVFKQNIDNNDKQKRQAEILFRLIQEREFVPMDDIADQLTVSRGTLLKDLAACRVWLKPYDLSIESATSRGIKLRVGSTVDLTMLIYNRLFDYVQARLFSDQTLVAVVIDRLNAAKIKTSTTQIFEKVMQIVVFLKQHHYKLSGISRYYTNLMEASPLFINIIEDIEDRCHVTFTQEEYNFLAFPFNLYANKLLSSEKLKQKVEANKVIFDQVADEIRNLVDAKIDYEQFYQATKYHLIFLINRGIFHISPSDYLTNKMLQRFQLAADMAMVMIDKLEEILGIHIADVEINYLTVYFEMALQHADSVSPDQPQVGFFSSMGQSVLRYLQNQLDTMFESKVSIRTFQDEADILTHQDQLIMVFTDRPLAFRLKIPVVMMGDIFRDRVLETKVRASAVQHEIDAGRIIWRAQTYANKPNQSYEAVLRATLQADSEAGLVDAGFIDRLIQHESTTKFVLDNGAAIPHAIADIDQNRLFLHLSVLTHAMTIGGKSVSYIFVIGIPRVLGKKALEDLSMLYDLLFLLAVNETAMANLRKISDSHDPLTVVTEGL
ncbi:MULTISPECIES: HTH domain-containing protein [Lacticaseibacillus]|uniref:Helix-turn-helix domain-containing protein n=2 Tax=Lacticaseibacillus TaxID=2759736 RepID=A0AAN1KFG1_LACCA|nr:MULTISPECIES: HTH domain-containing protein [Lacticaseibacillus]ARY92723.1 transcriptional regulator [Lacticaseibacillus casei]KAB1969435.1 HTH domain-containing protein [Lacticaseibacillus casei]WLV80624.1 helix-turn-helix domain-containing protein [Lacticaseibacillus sp. NCIMB 15473]WNX24584.1 helix-turn-helix domain-containing protein [Lacticaseibacillus casei]WNX27356.1 helix-turn-helix domain-containing protein [Lacticaseibacillus casei]